MFNTNFISTTNLNQFEKLKAPKFHTSLSAILMPNIELNKTYYRIIDNKIVAFQVLAITFQRGYSPSERYIEILVQYPNQEPIWETIKHKPFIFKSKDEYMEYMVNPSDKYRLQYTEIDLKNIINDYVYFWEDNSVVGKSYVDIEYLLYTMNGFLIGVKDMYCGKKVYTSKAQCIEENCNKVSFIDFEDTQKIDIQIEVTKSVTSVLRIMEV
jgi:hypothetical protein